jgi:DNA-binding CsgD family transcriptional regulator
MTTSLVLSVTILCAIIRIQAHNHGLGLYLPILIPLTLQLGIATLSSYVTRIVEPQALETDLIHSLSLLGAIVSIVLITLILSSVGLYIMRITREHIDPVPRRVGNWVILLPAALFIVFSIFSVLLVTEGDWAAAVSLTLQYYSAWGIVFLVPHVITAAVLLSRVTDRETQNHLRGILYAFAVVPFVFPLDLIYFSDHFFKLTYISFAAFSVVVYWHVSKRFVRDYLTIPHLDEEGDEAFDRFGLTPRERETARLLVLGKTNAEIAKELYISENTVRSHIKAIYRKADVANRVQLIHRIRFGGH